MIRSTATLAPQIWHLSHPEALNAGIERMQVDLGLTHDRNERFALWALLHALGSAPDLDVAFKSEADRDAARNFMDLIQGASGA